MFMHENTKHRCIRFTEIPNILLDLSQKISTFDFSVLNNIEQDADEYVSLGFGLNGAQDSNFTYIYGSIDDDMFVRFRFKNGELCHIKITNRHNTGGNMTAFQVLIGEKKILINESWFDRMNFEAEAFQKDTQAIYPFSLVGINDVLLSFGVQYERTNSDSGNENG
ncbi:hypothetical protein DQT32_03295 [Salmonella enterica subsp. enterica serovar Braenderup]|nr:hypothetical protein [Salmonella enterica subsp. enterica serovar Braenderup]